MDGENLQSLKGALFLFLTMPLCAQRVATAAELSRFLDELYRSKSSHATLSMAVTTPDYERSLTLESWSLGLEYSLIRIEEPRKEKGISTLKRENEMWNWLPKIQKMVRVPPSMMMGAWMGSDFTNDDLMRDSSWEEDFTVERGPDEGDTLVLISIPKPNAAVTWQKVVSYFNKQSWLPERQDFYDEKGRKVRSMTFDQVKEIGGRQIPSRIVLIPLLKPGNRTEVIYKDIVFDEPLDQAFFSQNNLKKGS